MITLTCQYCGQSFESERRNRRFCDRTCANRHRAERATKWETYCCAGCGAAVTTKPRYIGKYRYCDACRARRHADRLRTSGNRKPPVTLTCEQCGESFTVLACFSWRKYCSHACGAAAKVGRPHPKPRPAMTHEQRLARNREKVRVYRQRKIVEWDALPKIACACGCGTLIAPIGHLGQCVRYALGHGPGGVQTRFTQGLRPWNKDICGPDSHSWRGGTGMLPYGPGFTRKLKLAILERDGYICQRCGTTREQNGRALQVHHIDHNKANNDPANLVTVCNRCNIWHSNHRDQPFTRLAGQP